MADCIDFPRRRVYPTIVPAREMHEQEKPSNEMVWAVCPHLRINNIDLEDPRCHHCPEWENDNKYGKVQRVCYGLAVEVCKIVFVMQKRSEWVG